VTKSDPSGPSVQARVRTAGRGATRSSKAGKRAGKPSERPTVASFGGVTSPSTARGRRTRAALVNAARKLFEDVGYRETRISDIADQAETSYGVYYHYFESKQDVLRELMTSVAGEMFAASWAAPEGLDDPIAKIEESNRRYLQAASRNARMLAVIEESAVRDPFFRELKLQIREPFLRRNEAGIRRLQEQGIAAADLDPVLAASMLGGMVEHFSLMWFVHGVDYEEELAVQTLTNLWARAIGLSVGDTSLPSGETALVAQQSAVQQ
jgi:AcrR family transcriptional regulator